MKYGSWQKLYWMTLGMNILFIFIDRLEFLMNFHHWAKHDNFSPKKGTNFKNMV